jgi:hypothetical protein
VTFEPGGDQASPEVRGTIAADDDHDAVRSVVRSGEHAADKAGAFLQLSHGEVAPGRKWKGEL